MAGEDKEKIQPEHVLLVEDDPRFADIEKEILEDKGIQVTTTTSVEEAQELLEKARFSRVICDGLEGKWVDVAKKAKEKRLPYKLVSGNLEYIDQARELGIEFIDKGELFEMEDKL